MILKKNVVLASECGILSTLYKKSIEGKLTMYKVEIITDIIINLCVEKKTRDIVYGIIDLGKTFAIYTNVDFAEYKFSQNSTKNDSGDSFGSCAFMI
jgi:hypothetical protein